MNPSWVRRVLRAVFPWPTRPERRQAIAAARRDRIAAERKAAHAKARAQRLGAAVAQNHIAETIARQIRESR